MARTFFFAAAIAGFCAAATCSLTKRTPGTCRYDTECEMGQVCNTTGSQNQYRCVSADGGVPGCSDDNPCPTAGLTRCNPATRQCVECLAKTDCNGTNVCDPDTNSCVGCLLKTDCGGDTPLCDPDAKTCVGCLGTPGDCTGQKPICEAKACRACKSDGECGTDPGVCMEDGHCAAAGEVVYVEFNSTTCPNTTADGTSAKPYCAPNDAVAALGSRRVIIIRGPAVAMTVATPVSGLVVVGRNNTGGEPVGLAASIGTAITVSSGDILIRDLKVLGGAAAGAKGIVATGSATKLRLLRVTANLGTGLGIQADTGAEFHMDRCLVENNSAGGILINGATYDIQNTIIANNAFGITFTATDPPMPSQFRFNTISGSAGNAASCDPSKARSLSASIIVGVYAFCTLDNSVTATTSLGPTFHLTTAVACPNGNPANPPDHDFDGDLRTSPLDCGADQHTP